MLKDEGVLTPKMDDGQDEWRIFSRQRRSTHHELNNSTLWLFDETTMKLTKQISAHVCVSLVFHICWT